MEASGSGTNSKRENKRPRSPWKHLIYGAIAGATARTSVAPLERVKILKQIQHVDRGGVRYRGIIRSLLDIAKSEGIFRGFWKGNLANVLRIAPTAALRFGTFELYRNSFGGRSQSTSSLLVTSSCASLTASVLTYPLDVVRTRLMAQTPYNQLSSSHIISKHYTGIRDAFRTIIKYEGVAGFYKGLGASCIHSVPFVGVNFTVYENMRTLWIENRNWILQRMGLNSVDQGEGVGFWPGLLLGGCTGCISLITTYPFDVVQKRLVIQREKEPELRLYRGMKDAFLKIAKKEGAAGFLRGIVPACLKVIPSNAIKWAVIELCRRLGQ